MRALIAGGGIAGPTLAFWLRRAGWDVTLVERAPQPREGGYIVDFWGAGFDVADRMGIVPALRKEGYVVEEVRFVDGRGRHVGGFRADVFSKLTGGRFLSLPRSALARILLEALDPSVELIFGDSVAALSENGDHVTVSFENGPSRTFDVVIGADGLHSAVRRVAFGEDSKFERPMGYAVAAFETSGYPLRDELVYLMYTEVGRQVDRFSLRDGRTMFLFIFEAARDEMLPVTVEEQKNMLIARFKDCGWETPRILDALRSTDDLYFDRVSQIRMPAWSRGRIALVGDAAYCVSLLAGQGSALAMAGAYVLAHEMAVASPAEAFVQYHAKLAPLLRDKQRAAKRYAGWFAPSSRWGLWMRNRMSGLITWPIFAAIAARGFVDPVELPPPLPALPGESSAPR